MLGLLINFFFITEILAAKPQVVEVLKTENSSVAAIFPFDWMLTGAISSPIIMLLLWVFKEWWDSTKGDKKKLRADLDDVKEMVISIKAMLGDDLDHKIERKIDSAFRYYEKGKNI